MPKTSKRRSAPSAQKQERFALLKERLEHTRQLMADAGVDYLLVRSTDRFLNEYVPQKASFRVWITGFTGSTAEVIIGIDKAYIAVDSRYWLQAETEVDADIWDVVKVPFGERADQALARVILAESESGRFRIGFAAQSMTPRLLERYQNALPRSKWKALHPSLGETLMRDELEYVEPEIFAPDEDLFGETVEEKLGRLGEVLADHKVNGLFLQRLDELMWLSNLRGTELPYQSTFTCIGLVTKAQLFVALPNPDYVPEDVKQERPQVTFVGEDDLWRLIGQGSKRRIAFDPDNNTVDVQLRLEKMGAELVEVKAPVQTLRSRKNPEELEAMRRAFRRADRVVEQTIRWVCNAIERGERVTEAQVAEEVENRFEAMGATSLSFPVICAAGKNAAQIHYTTPNKRKALKQGDLLLLDTGAYFEEGYATDLSRTFLLGGARTPPTEDQKSFYTLVLKAAIAGMTAVLPIGSKGTQLDAIVRAPLWEAGLDYGHGTGHGVGINVHEFPPRIGPSSQGVLEVGHVFSVEPGYYSERFGGIRIENLCTLTEGPEGFMSVVPLTFSPLDRRLIDLKALTPKERTFLKWFGEEYRTQQQYI